MYSYCIVNRERVFYINYDDSPEESRLSKPTIPTHYQLFKMVIKIQHNERSRKTVLKESNKSFKRTRRVRKLEREIRIQ